MIGQVWEVLSTTVDRHGDEVLTDEGTLDVSAFAPRSSTEDNDNRAQVVTTGELYCMSAPELTAQHRLRSPVGVLWHVDGNPQQWERPYSGGTAGVVIPLRKVSG